MNHYVYEITNKVNGKKYIGKHSTELTFLKDDYYGSGVLMLKALSKYGRRNFSRKVIGQYETEREALDAEFKEIEKVNAYNNPQYYNLCQGGNEGMKNKHFSVYKYKGKRPLIIDVESYIAELKDNFTKTKNGSTYFKLNYYIGYCILHNDSKEKIMHDILDMAKDESKKIIGEVISLAESMYEDLINIPIELLEKDYQNPVVDIYESELATIDKLDSIDFGDSMDSYSAKRHLTALLIFYKLRRQYTDDQYIKVDKIPFRKISGVRITGAEYELLMDKLKSERFIYIYKNKIKIPFARFDGDDLFKSFRVSWNSSIIYDSYNGKSVIECEKCGRLTLCEDNDPVKLCPECILGSQNGLKIMQCVSCGERFVTKMRSRTIRCQSCYDEERKRIHRQNMERYRKKMIRGNVSA